MQALESAAEVYFHLHGVTQAFQDEFNLIKRHVKPARGLRNEITHAVTMDFVFAGGEDEAGVFLIPAMYGSRKTHAFVPRDADRLDVLRGKYRYTALDIMLISAKFRQFQQALLGFHGRFAAVYPPYEPK